MELKNVYVYCTKLNYSPFEKRAITYYLVFFKCCACSKSWKMYKSSKESRLQKHLNLTASFRNCGCIDNREEKLQMIVSLSLVPFPRSSPPWKCWNLMSSTATAPRSCYKLDLRFATVTACGQNWWLLGRGVGGGGGICLLLCGHFSYSCTPAEEWPDFGAVKLWLVKYEPWICLIGWVQYYSSIRLGNSMVQVVSAVLSKRTVAGSIPTIGEFSNRRPM